MEALFLFSFSITLAIMSFVTVIYIFFFTNYQDVERDPKYFNQQAILKKDLAKLKRATRMVNNGYYALLAGVICTVFAYMVYPMI